MRPPPFQKRSESDEVPALAASVLWKLTEYEDFVSPVLKAGAAAACSAAVEELGSPRAGPLQYWMQVAVQVCCRKARSFGLLWKGFNIFDCGVI